MTTPKKPRKIEIAPGALADFSEEEREQLVSLLREAFEAGESGKPVLSIGAGVTACPRCEKPFAESDERVSKAAKAVIIVCSGCDSVFAKELQ